MLVILIAAAGCSRFEFLYAFAGEAIKERAARYLDLDEAGEDEVARQTEALIAWHRNIMLPRYALYIDAQIEIVEKGGYDRSSVSDALSGLRRLLDETVIGAAPFIASVLADHTEPDKLRHMAARMSERQRELVEELEEPYSDRLAERRDDVIDNIERLLDELVPEQVSHVDRYAASSLDYSSKWLANRAARQDAFLAFMAEQPDRDEIAAFIHKVLLHSHEVADPHYKPVSEARWKVFEDLLAGVLTSMTAAQSAFFTKTLRGYANDFRDLSS